MRLALAIVLVAAFAIRAVYAFTLAPDVALLDDDFFYHATANALADGHGYVRPIDLLEGRIVPTAEHPPLYPVVLGLASLVGGTSVEVHRFVTVLIGTLAVLVVALIARRLAGDRAALAGAVLAAVYPAFVAADGSIMSEPLFGLLVALAVLQALRAAQRPSLAGAAMLGALVALATLTRSEAILLLPLLAVPVGLRARDRRWALMAVSVLAGVIVLAPWLIRNWTTFDRPLLSTNDGTTLAGANCPQTYAGPDFAWFVFDCAREPRGATGDEAERFAHLRERGLDYAADRPGRALVVAGVRVLNVWGLYKPSRHNVVAGRHLRVQQAGVIAFYIVALLALLALVRQRGATLAIVLAPLIVVTVAAAITLGTPRLRHGADAILLALAGVSVAALSAPGTGGSAPPQPSRRSSGAR
jgi:hypothetical protein